MKFRKPNGTIIELNEYPETLEKAAELGWVPVDEAKPDEKRRGRPPKEAK